MEEKLGIKGKIEYELRDINGTLKDSGEIGNTITNFMDAHVADQMSDSSETQIGFIALGTGTGQGASSVDLATFTAGTFLALSGTGPIQGTGGDDNDVIYSGFWGAGIGTATITEAGVFQASGTTRTTMSTYNDGLNVVKGASDTLKIDWTVMFGAS